MIRITSLGGSGEDSRNCFLVKTDTFSFLLDCGVRREIAEVSRVYPELNAELAQSLDAVILSHAHEDHTAALPYLYELGYRGNIYASTETIRTTPGFLHKWTIYVTQHGGTLPYNEDNIDRLSFRPVEELRFPVRYGRSGHIIGGLWYLFSAEGHKLLYTGDLTYDSLLLEADPLPEADILIIDSAYAGKRLDQNAQYAKLAETAHQVTQQSGKLLLPVPAYGRGIDMFLSLTKEDVPLYVENSIVKNTAELLKQDSWIRKFDMPAGTYTRVNNDNRSDVLQKNMSGVYLFGDGMMTSEVSSVYLEAVKNDPHSRIIISGHAAAGTPARRLLDESYRRENGVMAAADRLTIKVHNDESDVLALAEQVHPKHMMLFHSKAAACTSLIEKLSARGINVICGCGQTLSI